MPRASRSLGGFPSGRGTGAAAIERDAELGVERLRQLAERLVIGVALSASAAEHAHDAAFGDVEQLVVDVLAEHRIAPAVVERLALLVHHVVVVEQLLAHVEVARLDLLLRVLDDAREHAILDRLALLARRPDPTSA